MLANRYRWVMLLMLFLAMVINYVDRAALSVAMPFMLEDFHLTPSERGIIFSAFFLGYAAFNFIGGYLSDRIGPMRVFLWSMTLWSIICGLTSVAVGFWSLLIIRALFGAGEGPVSTTANKTVNNWFPVRERARAVGLNQAGGPLGGAIAGPVVGLIAIYFGWQYSFMAMAVMGLLWSVAWKVLATDYPAQNRRVSSQELTLIELGQKEGSESAERLQEKTADKSTLQVIFSVPVLAIAVSLFCYNYVLFFFMTWFPSYLIEARGMSLEQMSWATSIPWLIGGVGYMSGGLLIDAIYRRTGRQLLSRKLVLVSCLLLAAIFIGLTGNVNDASLAVILMTVAIGFLMLAAPAFWTLVQDSVASRHVGTAGGFVHGFANISGIVAPTVTGFMVGGGSYGNAFILAGVLGTLGALSVAFLVRGSSSSSAKSKTAHQTQPH